MTISNKLFLFASTFVVVSLIVSVSANDNDKLKSNQVQQAEFDSISFTHPVRQISWLDFSVTDDIQTEKQINTNQTSTENDWPTQSETAQIPGLLLLEYLPTGNDLHLLFYDKEGKARKVLTVALQRRYADGGGFSTIDYINLIWDKSQSDFASLYITQTSIPGKADRPFMPGPPITRVFEYDLKTQMYIPKSED